MLRGQRLTPAQFHAFARRFGPPEPHVIDQFHHPDIADILILSNVSGTASRPALRTRYVFPYRLLVPGCARALHDAVLARRAEGRRRHAVRQPVRGVRRSVATMKARIENLVGLHHYGNRDDLNESLTHGRLGPFRRAEKQNELGSASRSPALTR